MSEGPDAAGGLTPRAGVSAVATAPLPYRETLLPRPWAWLLPLGFAGCLGIAFGVAYDATMGWFVFGATSALLVLWLIVAWPTRIAVDTDHVRADRAALPVQFIGRVKALSKDETFTARTAEADPRAFTMLRTWAAITAVIFEVTDPADPHPHWLVSTRHPEALADAIVAARDAARAG